MSVFLDDLMDHVQQCAYRHAAGITRAQSTVREAQVRMDWSVIAPAATRLLENLPTQSARTHARPLIRALNEAPTQPRATQPGGGPSDEARALAQAFGAVADVLTDPRARGENPAEEDQALLGLTATALGATGRVLAAASAAAQDDRDGISRRRADAIVAACHDITHSTARPEGGLVPAPGTIASAVDTWVRTSRDALSAAEVDARTLRTIPADLASISAATATLTRAVGREPDPGLQQTHTAWRAVIQAWPPQLAAQPGGRLPFEHLEASRNLHDSLRVLRDGAGWATPAQIRDRIDPENELRALTYLARTRIPELGETYTSTVTTLLHSEVLVWPARLMTRPDEGFTREVAEAVSRGRWVPLPAQAQPAQGLRRAVSDANATTRRTGAVLAATEHQERAHDARTPVTRPPASAQDLPRRPDAPMTTRAM